MAEYQHITDYDGVLRYVDSATIPPDDGNADWNIYLQYVEDGGITDPAPPPPDPPPPVPDPNVRLDNGVDAAVSKYDELTPAVAPAAGGSGGLSVEERLLRIEETVKAMCEGHMADTLSADL
jgi:hypothetical protein